MGWGCRWLGGELTAKFCNDLPPSGTSPTLNFRYGAPNDCPRRSGRLRFGLSWYTAGMGRTLHGFAPIVGESPYALVLGNMPSVMSLSVKQYYGNPRNAFWPIMGALYGFDAGGPYPQRTAALMANRIAVWDVLRSCRREGSLDSSVERDSMVTNDFAAFFATHPTIRRVFFNGGAAEANFRRLARVYVPLDVAVDYVRLPSTSPAHTIPFAAKLAAWREILAG
jgi:hypoxanthine-DNA glycosylase